MLNLEQRETIIVLRKSGESYRSIARKLGIDRKTVASVFAEETEKPETADKPQKQATQLEEHLIRELHAECNGYVQRIHEKLQDEHNIIVPYSTLTQRCRELGLSKRVTKNKKRFHHVEMGPGEEMQHDTSSYLIDLGETRVRVTASIIYLRYSKMSYLKFYLRFQRYDLKCFIHEALQYFGGSANVCIIDNTNLARLKGVGASAIMSSEIETFSKTYGFEFFCHELKHSNRKAGNERAFWTNETNFLPGRQFKNLDDLNAQALEWATQRRPKVPNSKTHLVPAELMETEKKYLNPVILNLSGPMQIHYRYIDRHGFVEFRANFFWIPGKDRFTVTIIEQPKKLLMLRDREELVCYDKPAQDVKKLAFKPEGMDTNPHRIRRTRATQLEESDLKKCGPHTEAYLQFILEESKGVRKSNMIRWLHSLSRQISPELLEATLLRALEYQITDFNVIENIASQILGVKGHILPTTEIDVELENRETYREGRISPSPDLSVYAIKSDEEDSENPSEGDSEKIDEENSTSSNEEDSPC